MSAPPPTLAEFAGRGRGREPHLGKALGVDRLWTTRTATTGGVLNGSIR